MNKQVTIDIDHDLIDELFNAVAAYGRLCFGAMLGTSIATDFDFLKDRPLKELQEKFTKLKKFAVELNLKYYDEGEKNENH